MKRLLAAAILAACITAPIEANAKPYMGPCDDLSVRETIICAVAVWPVPGGAPYALAIADRESGFSSSAVSPSGTYMGVYQIGNYHMPAWPNAMMGGEWWHRWFPKLDWNDPASLLNGRFNVILAIRVAHAGGWGPWGG